MVDRISQGPRGDGHIVMNTEHYSTYAEVNYNDGATTIVAVCSAAGDRLVGPRSPDGAAVEGVHVEARLPQPGGLQ